ncbi:TIGR02234 family membrane protein [Corynebacterium sp. ED61]|uniref:TIGR02234 family membrane protein n=1 Tax=Corynebacterium sp. ED61 TaxID=2211360 RepID=UPI001883B3B5|nr:TIGR02234 family membrane protein [Corynebacterium sp. ED61]MBF0580657.1 TIGR02234 family membrane protein [Corynebacterium sp. ED61]
MAGQTSVAKRNRSMALILVVLSAAGLWGAGRMKYVTAQIFDDKTGEFSRSLVGSVWDPAATPLALAMLACLILSLAMQPLIRRILGVLVVLLAGTASFRSVSLLTTDVDLMRVRDLLVSGVATQRQNAPETISDWAQVASTEVHTAPVLLAIVAAALGVIGGVILAMQPGERTEANSRYVTPEVRREHVHEDLADNPDSSRVLWDALDAGVDPTEADEADEAERNDANREAKNRPKGDGQTKG